MRERPRKAESRTDQRWLETLSSATARCLGLEDNWMSQKVSLLIED